MRINFDLRNELQILKKNQKNFEINSFLQKKENVDVFIKYFNKVRQYEHNDLHEVALTINEDIKILKNLRELTNEMEQIKEERKTCKSRIKETGRQLDENEENKEKTLKELNQIISISNARCVKLQNEIEDIKPANNALRQRVEEKEERKHKIFELLQDRTKVVQEARKLHEDAQEKRREVKAELRTELGKLTAEYNNLLYQEKPLIKALEEAESNLKATQEQSNNQINEIQQQIKVANHKILSISKRISEHVIAKKKNQDEMEETKRIVEIRKHKHDFGLVELRNRRNQVERIDAQIREFVKEGSTAEEEIQIINEKKQQNAERIQKLNQQIETLRKENQKIASLIRVSQESTDELESENESMRIEVSETETKVREEKISFTEEMNRRQLARATIKAFNNMSEGMRMESIGNAMLVAEKAVDFVREAKGKCQVCQNCIDEDPIPMRVTTKMVSDGIDNLAISISKLEEKLQ